MDEKKRIEIVNYFQTFFGIIRDFTQKESEYAPFVPEIFKWVYLFLVFDCMDGFVVAAYPSGFADNFISITQKKPVKDVLRRLPNKILGTENHIVMGVEKWGGKGRWEIILDRIETNREPLPTTGWKFLHISTRSEVWDVHDAKRNANEFINIFKARSSIFDPTSSGGFIQNYDRIFLRQEITKRLFDILENYKTIISEQNFRERIIHKFLRDHPVMIHPTKKRLIYEHPFKHKGQTKFRVDFVIELTTERYVLVELENPKHRIFTQSNDFSQAVNHAERQVEDWILWTRQNLNSVQSSLPGFLSPEGLIVIGRGNELTQQQKDKIKIRNETHNIKLMTYDDLAEEAKHHILHIIEA